jgi:hypothetical protein
MEKAAKFGPRVSSAVRDAGFVAGKRTQGEKRMRVASRE